MEAKLGKAGKQAFEIANLLDDAADAIRERSRRDYREGRMSLEEYMEARAKELELRSQLSVLVATGLSSALEETAGPGERIEHAIREAKARIDTIASLEGGLEIVAALIQLAGALASGDVKLMLSSTMAVAKGT